MEKFLALKASAGSGKTFALTVRYISLLLLEAKPKEILTLTFTNKAASQMTQRIYDTLVNLGNDQVILDEITKQTGFTQEQILEKKSLILQRFASDELAIFTIDKFINKILREFCGYVNINDDFAIEFDDEELLVYKFLQSLDEKQFDTLISFAYSQNKRLSSIVELFKSLIEKNETVSLQNYPKQSFTAVQKQIMDDANSIKEFVDQSALSNSAKKAVDFDDIDTLLDKGKTWLTKDSLGEFTYFKKDKSILALDEKLHSLQKNLQLYFHINESLVLEKLFELFHSFENFRSGYNKKRNSLEFSDITNIVYKLLESHVEKEFLYFRLDAVYHHMLIDEFQDTSTLQFKILQKLIDEIILADQEKFKTFFYVGDVKQSIYRFRGGQKELFDYVAKIYQPHLKVELLDTNYRSSQNVVNFVNDTFEPLVNYPYDKQYVKSSTKGYVEVCKSLNDFDSIALSIGDKIEDLLSKGIDYNNIAILTYTNSDVLGLYDYLHHRFSHIKIATEMTSRLVNQTNVKALINLVKYFYFRQNIYKYNFNALRGEEYDKECSIQVDLKDKVQKILKILAYSYNLVDDDVIKLIQKASSFDTIVDFVYEIEKNDETVFSSEKKGLQILTVFKSKGLEFDTVLVCDRISKKVPDRNALLFEYEDINLKNIFYKKSGRENLDSYYETAIEKEKKLVIDDELNILYVALTRAKNNMIVFKKEKSSVFENLGDFPIQIIGELFVSSSKQQSSQNIQQAHYVPLDLGYQEKTKSSNKVLDLKAQVFGTATHYCLEMMKEFTKQSLEKIFVKVQNKFSNSLEEKEFEDLYQRVLLLIENQEFQSILKNANFTKEQSMVYNKEHKIIDLLVQKEEYFHIFDYKTSDHKSNEHITQVKQYCKAVQSISKLQTKGTLVYLHKDSVELFHID